MELEILYFGKLRDMSGGKTRDIVAVDDAQDLKGLIKELEEKHGKDFAEALDATKGLRILVNGRDYQQLAGMDTKLKDKDTVVLLPPIFGG